MTASTLSEMVEAARESCANSNLSGFGESATWIPPGGAERTVYVKVRPSRELRSMPRRIDDQEAVDVYLRRDETHATQPGVETLALKSELRLADGRVFTFHGRVLHENTVRRVIVMTRDIPVTQGR